MHCYNVIMLEFLYSLEIYTMKYVYIRGKELFFCLPGFCVTAPSDS